MIICIHIHKWDMCFLSRMRTQTRARSRAHTHTQSHTHKFLLSPFVSFNFVFFLGFQMSNEILGRNFGRCGGGKGASKKEGIAQVTSKGGIKFCLVRETVGHDVGLQLSQYPSRISVLKREFFLEASIFQHHGWSSLGESSVESTFR